MKISLKLFQNKHLSIKSQDKNGKTKVYTRTAGPATNGVPSAYRPRTLERSSSGGAAGRRHPHMRHVASLHEIVEGRTLDLDSPTGDPQDEVSTLATI